MVMNGSIVAYMDSARENPHIVTDRYLISKLDKLCRSTDSANLDTLAQLEPGAHP